VLLEVVLDVCRRVGRREPLGGREHRRIEMVPRERVDLVYVRRELGDDLRGLASQHGRQPDDEHDQRQEQCHQQQTRRGSPTPVVLLVEPDHRRLEGEREQLGQDEVADKTPLRPKEPQRREGHQDGADRIPDAFAHELRRRRRDPVSLGRGGGRWGVAVRHRPDSRLDEDNPSLFGRSSPTPAVVSLSVAGRAFQTGRWLAGGDPCLGAGAPSHAGVPDGSRVQTRFLGTPFPVARARTGRRALRLGADRISQRRISRTPANLVLDAAAPLERLPEAIHGRPQVANPRAI
jgi:hypothetical protein